MNGRRDRLETVLRVRRIQETQAAAGFTIAARAARRAEEQLAASFARYDQHRTVDLRAGAVADVLRDRDIRVLQARAIQRGRDQVRDTVSAMEARRDDLRVRTQAVRAMERLDERLRDEEEAERMRREQRELDDRTRPSGGHDLEVVS